MDGQIKSRHGLDLQRIQYFDKLRIYLCRFFNFLGKEMINEVLKTLWALIFYYFGFLKRSEFEPMILEMNSDNIPKSV